MLQRRDSLDKVIKVLDSKAFAKPQPSTSKCAVASLPKDKLLLNSETLLILNLLGMQSSVREQYLIEVAKERRLLLTNPKTNTFNVNPELFDIDSVPQVVDFVHQFHGKPIVVTESGINVTRKLKQKVKKKEKEKKPLRTMVFESQKSNPTETTERNTQITKNERTKNVSTDGGSVVVPQQPQKSNKNALNGSEQIRASLKDSAQSVSMSHLNKIIEKPAKKPRTLSACEQAISRVQRQVDACRQNADEEISKRQQKRLRKKLRAMSIECKEAANAEKPPRKRGSRGSKKSSDLVANQQLTLTPQSNSMGNVAAKNLIHAECTQIDGTIHDKLSMQPGPSTSSRHSEDLIVESIDRGKKMDVDNDSSSVSSDSSNFPDDEETTSYFAKSDEMESSCNEKRAVSSFVQATASAKKNVKKEEFSAVSSK